MKILLNSVLLRILFLLCFSVSAQASVLGFVEFEGESGVLDSPGYITKDVIESPDGKFVYSVSSVNSFINAFSRDQQTGELTYIHSVASKSADGMAISPDGKYIYVSGLSDPHDEAISWYSRDADTGMLTFSGKILQDNDMNGAYTNPNGILRISSDGFFLYAGDMGGGGHIVVFSRANNGVLSYVQTVTSGNDLAGLNKFTISPDGKNVYAVSHISRELDVFTRDTTTGQLTFAQVIQDESKSAHGIAGLETPEDVIVSADGKYVYTTGKIQNNPSTTGDDDYTILTFQRNTTDGTLSYLTSTTNRAQHNTIDDWDTLWWPTSLAFSADSDQKFLYVGTNISDAINVFRRNPEDGGLSWVGWETEGKNGVTHLDSIQNMFVSNDGRHIYTALEGGDGIAVFDVRADLSLVKTDSTDPVEPESNFSYTIAVTNNGPSDAQNVIVTDTLPEDMTYTSATVNAPGGSCAVNVNIVTCELGNIADSASVNTLIEVTSPVASGSITNSATVTADQFDEAVSNNSDDESTCVEASASGVCSDAEEEAAGMSLFSLMMLLLLSRLFAHRTHQKIKQ